MVRDRIKAEKTLIYKLNAHNWFGLQYFFCWLSLHRDAERTFRNIDRIQSRRLVQQNVLWEIIHFFRHFERYAGRVPDLIDVNIVEFPDSYRVSLS